MRSTGYAPPFVSRWSAVIGPHGYLAAFSSFSEFKGLRNSGQKEGTRISSYNVLGRALKRLEAMGLKQCYAFIELFKFTVCIITGYKDAVWFKIYVNSVVQAKFPPISFPIFPGVSSINIHTPYAKTSFSHPYRRGATIKRQVVVVKSISLKTSSFSPSIRKKIFLQVTQEF